MARTNSDVGRERWTGGVKVYRTAAGSEVRRTGQYGGQYEVSFDWLEEGACFDCQPLIPPHDGALHWRCEQCGGGSAALILVPDPRRAGVLSTS
jgi:hypothetical protein